jgi:hypothetical protein
MLKSRSMREEIRPLVEAIHNDPVQLMMVTAGAGTQALSWLLSVAGASRTLLEAVVPYSEAAFDDFLGQQPAKYVDEATAGYLAGRAYTRACQLSAGPRLVGLACTATIITDRPKRGEHRAYLATWQPERVCRYRLYFLKGARDREGEEDVVSRIMLNALAFACGLKLRVDVPLIAGDQLTREVASLQKAAEQLSAQEISSFTIQPDGYLQSGKRPPVILSGAFNPLHEGHVELARVAGDFLGEPVTFEVSAVNVDKPPLAVTTLLQRLSQFAGRWPVCTSGAPTYQQKAAVYPGATFVIGYDTAARILEPRYYDGSRAAVAAALRQIEERGCRFLVAGRLTDDGRFHEADDLPVPEQFRHLFQAIPGSRFRHDISSTFLRAHGRPGSR